MSNAVRIKKKGLAPGSIVFTGQQYLPEVDVYGLLYGPQTFQEIHTPDLKSFKPLAVADDTVTWYDIDGMHNTDFIRRIGEYYEIHALILEDIPEVHQRPKFEVYDRGNFVVFKSITFDAIRHVFTQEHVAIYFRKGLVLSFQEGHNDLFAAVRQRLELSSGRIRSRGADYLAYALLDVVIDHYMEVLDLAEEEIAKLEELILEDQNERTKAKIHHLKKELISIRRLFIPLREAVNRFGKADVPFIEKSTRFFIRDLYDHTSHVGEMIEAQLEMVSSLQDLFMSEVSYRMNQVMQVLTIVSTIFIPMTFLAGVYGMNFEYIPELGWRYGYFSFWVLTVVVFVGLIAFFRYKRWL